MQSRFFKLQKKEGAKMMQFAGWEMPAYYTSIREEHAAVRKCVGLFDISHMSEFLIEGKGALELLNYLTPNSVDTLTKGKAQYSALLNEKGCFIDDILIYALEPPQRYMIVGNATNRKKDAQWIQKHLHDGVTLQDISSDISMLALQGPSATQLLQELCPQQSINDITFYHFIEISLAGIKNVLISATGYTGEKGFELYIQNKEEAPERIWHAIVSIGQKYNLQLAGLGCRDTLRLEMGYPLHGSDIDEMYNAIEAGLKWIVKFQKKDNFIGRNALEQIKVSDRKRIGFIIDKGGIARSGQTIENEKGDNIGVVTSATLSPSLEKAIGMGYCQLDALVLSSTIYIQQHRKQLKATICSLPFLKK